MKRIVLLTILLALVMECFVACKEENSFEEKNDVYESLVMDVANDNTGISKENNFWDLNSFEKTDISDKTISVCEKTYTGHYEKSFVDKYNSYTTDFYCDENYIEFGLRSDTGELVLFNRMNAEFFDTEPYLDDVNEPEQNAISLATKIAGNYVDLSDYTQIIEPSQTQYKEKYGKTYTITYYVITFAKEVQGYLSTDFISVKVTSKGNLASIYMGDINAFENIQFNIKNTNVNNSISKKVDSVYAEAEINVESQDVYYQRIAVAPAGQVVICSRIKVFAQDKNKEEIRTEISTVTVVYSN